MKKEVIKVGGESLGVRFTIPERSIYGISEGDIVDLGDLVVIKSQEEASDNLSDILAKQKQPNIAKSILDEVLENG